MYTADAALAVGGGGGGGYTAKLFGKISKPIWRKKGTTSNSFKLIPNKF